ncbi:MAG TPA: fibronectin type III domain-containing protein [Bacteroidia bacterium]|nr:fibronectin type III domain-containing protein [Bacteroidia bacterium]
MSKAKVKITFIKIPIPEKIEYARDRVTDMTGNPNFVMPDPALPVVGAAATDLETKYNKAQGGGPADTIAQNAAEEVLDDLMRDEADYVDDIADGSEVIISSAGFTPTQTEQTPVQKPLKPENLKNKHLDQPGSISSVCDKVENAKAYATVIATSQDGQVTVAGEDVIITSGTGVVIVNISTNRKTTHTGLTSGTKYWVRKFAINAAGRGPDSDVIPIVAP